MRVRIERRDFSEVFGGALSFVTDGQYNLSRRFIEVFDNCYGLVDLKISLRLYWVFIKGFFTLEEM